MKICYVQSDMPYLQFCVLNKLQRHLCDKVCLKKFFTDAYTTVYYIKYSSGINISSKKFNSSFRKRCSNTYSKWVVSSFAHKLGSKFRRFRASKNYNTMSILCVERLFLGVADDGSLLKERGIHSV